MLGMQRLGGSPSKWSSNPQTKHGTVSGTHKQGLPSQRANTLPEVHLQQHAPTRRKCVKASQLSNMRSPMRRNVSCSSRPARAFSPKALSAMRSNA